MIVISGALIVPISVTSLYSQHMGIYRNTYGKVDILICIIDREMDTLEYCKRCQSSPDIIPPSLLLSISEGSIKYVINNV